MGLKISAAVYSHIGHRRNNEDNFFFNGTYMEREQMDKGGQLEAVYSDAQQMFAVCDGMGGAELGEEASLRAVRALKKFKDTCPQMDSTVYLDKMIDETSRIVDDISVSRGRPSGDSGSTIAMLVMKDWYFRTVHVGDSRIYRLRGDQLERMTKDDSEVQQMVDRGELTLDEAWKHPRKNVITKHLGMPLDEGEKLKPTVSARQELKEGDRFLICSDGLTDEVHDSVIKSILKSGRSAAEIAPQLVRRALSDSEDAHISSDNITVIVLDVLKAGKMDSNAKRIQQMQTIRAALIGAAALLFGGFAYTGWRVLELLLKK